MDRRPALPDGLASAITQGDLTAMAAYLDVNTSEGKEVAKDALLFAIEGNHMKCAAKLMSMCDFVSDNVPIRLVSPPGYKTLLHFAVMSSCVGLIRSLLEGGYDVNTKADREQSALHAACMVGNVKIFQVLFDHGVNVNARNSEGEAPLHHAASMCIDADCVRMLVGHPNVDLDPQNLCGMTPLMMAVESGAYESAEILLEAGADCNELLDCRSYLPLHWAVRTRKNRVAEILLKKLTPMAREYMCMNCRPCEEVEDILCIACRYNQDILPSLLKSGFRLSVDCYQAIDGSPDSDMCMTRLTHSEVTPLKSLFEKRKFRAAKYHYAMPVTLLLWSHGQQSRFDALKAYLDAGLRVNPTHQDASPPLALFIRHYHSHGLTDSLHLSILRLLESRGLDPDYTSRHNTFGAPDSLVAASISDPRTLAFLLKFSRTMPDWLLYRWTAVLNGDDEGARVVKPDHRRLFAAHMKAICSVAVEFGGSCLCAKGVKKFQEAVEGATRERADWAHLHEQLGCVSSLQHMCRWAVRCALSRSLRQGQLLKRALDQLELPERLKGFLLYHDVDLLQFPIGQDEDHVW